MTPDRIIEASDQLDAVLDVMATLEFRDRVIMWHRMRGYTHRQISWIFDIPMSTVWKREDKSMGIIKREMSRMN